MKKTLIQTLTSTNGRLFPTFKATLSMLDIDLEKAEFCIYTEKGWGTLANDISIDELENMLPFFSRINENYVDIEWNTENHCVGITLGMK